MPRRPSYHDLPAKKRELESRQRKTADQALLESEKKFKTWTDHSPNMIFVNKMGRVVYVNKMCEKIMGFSEADFLSPDFNFFDLIAPESMEIVRANFERHKRGEDVAPYEYTLIDRAGRRIESLITTRLIDYEGGPAILGIITDISERKAMEKALRESEERFRLISENSWDMVCLHDQDLKTLYVSPAITPLLGYQPSEIIGKRITDFLHPSEIGRSTSRVSELLEGAPFLSIENRVRSKEGRYVWMETLLTKVTEGDGTFRAFQAISRDISQRKQIETALKKSEARLRILSNELINAQERERRRISIELHDELGQALVGLKFQVSNLKKKLERDRQGGLEDLEKILRYLDETTENVRRLSRELSPSVLEHLGLDEALDWLIDQFSRETGLSVFEKKKAFGRLFSKEQEIIIYRIFQEALSNIKKHAQARHLSIVAGGGKDTVSFVVEDDGQGFSLREVVSRSITDRGLGLASMEERARMAGGTFKLISRRGKGTRITFTIPTSRKTRLK